MSAIGNDAAMSHNMDLNDVEDEFLKRITAKEDAKADSPTPSDDDDVNQDEEEEPDEAEDEDESDPEETPEEDESEDEAEEDDDDEEEVEEKPKKVIKKVADDEAVTKVKVDGKEIEVPVKDLKRLYGQEKALTQKAQEAANLKKMADDAGARSVAAYDVILQKAKARLEPYAKLNFLALAKDPTISGEQLEVLRAEGQKAFDDVQFLEQGINQHLQQAENGRRAQQAQAAQVCVQALRDPKTGIPNWNQETYQNIMDFGVKSGLAKDIVHSLVDPAAIKLIHMAMLYQKGQEATKIIKKTDKSPKRILKGTTKTINKSSDDASTTTIGRLRKSGKVDDAASVFFSRMKDR